MTARLHLKKMYYIFIFIDIMVVKDFKKREKDIKEKIKALPPLKLPLEKI